MKEDDVLVREDMDAATRFFRAVSEQQVDAEEEAASESSGASSLDFSRFRARRFRQRLLGLLDELIGAIDRRDLRAVWAVLEAADANRCFPSSVQSEALVIAQLPHTAYRAPIRLYRYYQLLTQLGDEPLELTQDLAPLSFDVAPPAPPTPVRELRFPDRRSPDDDPRGGPRIGPRDGGSSRRRSGSR
jgi:hypothetical protein